MPELGKASPILPEGGACWPAGPHPETPGWKQTAAEEEKATRLGSGGGRGLVTNTPETLKEHREAGQPPMHSYGADREDFWGNGKTLTCTGFQCLGLADENRDTGSPYKPPPQMGRWANSTLMAPHLSSFPALFPQPLFTPAGHLQTVFPLPHSTSAPVWPAGLEPGTSALLPSQN